MPRGSRSTNVPAGSHWNSIGLKRYTRIKVGNVARVPEPHYDPIKALLGEPRPGQSALDKRRADQAKDPEPEAPFAVDWSKISAAGSADAPNLESDGEDDGADQ